MLKSHFLSFGRTHDFFVSKTALGGLMSVPFRLVQVPAGATVHPLGDNSILVFFSCLCSKLLEKIIHHQKKWVIDTFQALPREACLFYAFASKYRGRISETYRN